jgi:RNA polymerase sigma factor (sigma-70 family)
LLTQIYLSFFNKKLLAISWQKSVKFLLRKFVILIRRLFFFLSENLSQKTDNEIAVLTCQNSEYFSEIFDRFFEKSYRFFYFRLRHQENAEDLTSELFEKIFKNLNKFKDQGVPFGAWFFRVAHNLLIDFYRRNKNKVEIKIDEMPENLAATDFDIEQIDRKFLQEKLWAAIRQLPERQQQIWALKLAQDLSAKQIAEILDIKKNNVEVTISRSTKELKKIIKNLDPNAN